MRLKYKILWVDDRMDSFIDLGLNTELEKYLSELFFEPSITLCETAKQARDFTDEIKYDLIFSDYNIGQEKGDDFIKYVRENNINTEILFYSAQDKVPGLDNDRITFFSIPNMDSGYSQLSAKMVALIDLTIAKLQELTTIRGLVMAETSQLDKIMEEIIHKYYIVNVTDSSDVSYKEIITDIENNHKKKLDRAPTNCNKGCSLKLRHKQKEDVIHSLEFDSSRKARAINKIIGSLSFKYVAIQGNFYKDYLEEIIQVRNNLAHSHSEIRDGIEVLITKKSNSEVIFDEDTFRNIRRCILKYTSILNELKNNI